MVWTTRQRVQAVSAYLRIGSPVITQRALRREHGWRRVPSARVLRQWVRGFQTLGTVAIHAPRPWVPVALVWAIRRAVARNPRLSVRRLAARMGAQRSTVYNVERRQLGVFAYKLQLVQRLKRGDKAKRL